MDRTGLLIIGAVALLVGLVFFVLQKDLACVLLGGCLQWGIGYTNAATQKINTIASIGGALSVGGIVALISAALKKEGK